MPRLADVALLERILGNHGVDIMVSGKRSGETADHGQTLHISASRIVDTTAPYELVSKMRASFWVLAPLVARMGEAKVSMPGGCAIGTRPVDLLIMAVARLGADNRNRSRLCGGARAAWAYKGAEIVFPKVTVGGTHTAMMAATLGQGHDGDRERRARSPKSPMSPTASTRWARGFPALAPSRSSSRASPDWTARGTRCCPTGSRPAPMPWRPPWPAATSCCRTRGRNCCRPRSMCSSALASTVTPTNQGIRIARNGVGLAPVDVTTAPFPEFPTDLQAQLMALMTRAHGTSHITETIFENRFMHVGELTRLGARIQLDGERATIEGVAAAQGRAGHGDRPARFGVAGDRGACRRRRNHRQSRLSPRPRFRAARGQARTLRRGNRAAVRLTRIC